jgi:TrmH family RNA methyltransferase
MKRFCIVLARPQHARNIGACARVAANFDVAELRLVAPVCKDWRSDPEAGKLAVASSRELFESIREYPDLASAIADCQVAVGFTRRSGKSRRLTQPFLTLPEFQPGSTERTALVFGNEEWGLSEEETHFCTQLAEIPTSSRLGSMNLSHAVAVVLAPLFSGMTAAAPPDVPEERSRGSLPRGGWKRRKIERATLAENEGLFAQWREVLVQVGLTTAGNPDRMLQRIREILLRGTGLSQADVRLLRGFLSKVSQSHASAWERRPPTPRTQRASVAPGSSGAPGAPEEAGRKAGSRRNSSSGK